MTLTESEVQMFHVFYVITFSPLKIYPGRVNLILVILSYLEFDVSLHFNWLLFKLSYYPFSL